MAGPRVWRFRLGIAPRVHGMRIHRPTKPSWRSPRPCGCLRHKGPCIPLSVSGRCWPPPSHGCPMPLGQGCGECCNGRSWWRSWTRRSRGKRPCRCCKSSSQDDVRLARHEAVEVELPGVSDRAPATEVARRSPRVAGASAEIVGVVARPPEKVRQYLQISNQVAVELPPEKRPRWRLRLEKVPQSGQVTLQLTYLCFRLATLACRTSLTSCYSASRNSRLRVPHSSTFRHSFWRRASMRGFRVPFGLADRRHADLD